MNFVTRADAFKMLRDAYKSHCDCCVNKHAFDNVENSVWRNYEIERKLEITFGGKWCVTDWCPCNGRFCQVADYVPYPHPPAWNRNPEPPETNVPWNDWQPHMTEKLR